MISGHVLDIDEIDVNAILKRQKDKLNIARNELKKSKSKTKALQLSINTEQQQVNELKALVQQAKVNIFRLLVIRFLVVGWDVTLDVDLKAKDEDGESQ